VVRSLGERPLLEPRPGRTADEAAREAGARLPDLAAGLVAGARLFDAVRYGGHACGSTDHERLRTLDDAVRRGRPVAVGAGSGPPAVPR
jgi:hypothetical protein